LILIQSRRTEREASTTNAVCTTLLHCEFSRAAFMKLALFSVKLFSITLNVSSVQLSPPYCEEARPPPFDTTYSLPAGVSANFSIMLIT